MSSWDDMGSNSASPIGLSSLARCVRRVQGAGQAYWTGCLWAQVLEEDEEEEPAWKAAAVSQGHARTFRAQYGDGPWAVPSAVHP